MDRLTVEHCGCSRQREQRSGFRRGVRPRPARPRSRLRRSPAPPPAQPTRRRQAAPRPQPRPAAPGRRPTRPSRRPPRRRIRSEEEERVRTGYRIQTYFRYSEGTGASATTKAVVPMVRQRTSAAHLPSAAFASQGCLQFKHERGLHRDGQERPPYMTVASPLAYRSAPRAVRGSEPARTGAESRAACAVGAPAPPAFQPGTPPR